MAIFNTVVNSNDIITISNVERKVIFDDLLENTFTKFYNTISDNFDIFLIIKTNIPNIGEAMYDDETKKNTLYQNLIETLVLQQEYFQIMGFIYLIPIPNKKVLTIWQVQTKFFPELPLENILENFLEYALLNLPKDTLLWTMFPTNTPYVEQIVRSYAIVGFDKPIINVFKHKCVFSLSHINGYIPKKNIDPDYVLREFNAIVNNTDTSSQNNICSLSLTFNKNFVNWLAKLPQRHTTLNSDGTLSQKEIGGSMLLANLQEYNKQYYWELHLDTKKDFLVGTEEYVNIVNIGRYAFHSHPIEIMELRKKEGLYIGVPSGTDYFSTLKYALSSGDFLIFHSIISVEGIYIISINQELCKSPQIIQYINNLDPTVMKQKIMENFEWSLLAQKYMNQIYPNLNLSQEHIPAYVNIVSNIPTSIFPNMPNVPNMPKIFTLQFYTWSEARAPNFRFTVFYRKTNDMCFNCNHSNTYRNEIIKEYLQ